MMPKLQTFATGCSFEFSAPPLLLLLFAAAQRPPAALAAATDTCTPSQITDTNNAGCGRWFPRFHPKNARPLAHNNDANAPFEYAGIHHLFMQANFPGVRNWTVGAIGLGHLASRDLATWVVAPPALVPGHWGGDIGGVGKPAGNATEGYYSGSATIVNGEPRIIIPAVFFKPEDHHGCPVTCEDHDSWHCMLNPQQVARCAMTYVESHPLNLSDPCELRLLFGLLKNSTEVPCHLRGRCLLLSALRVVRADLHSGWPS